MCKTRDRAGNCSAPGIPIKKKTPACSGAFSGISLDANRDVLGNVSTAPSDGRPARFDRDALAQMDAMYSFAFKLTEVREEAEDLVSETMLRAFERWRQFNLGTNIRAWLFTILYHAFVSRKRRIDAREVQPLEDEDGREIFEAVGDADPERTFYDSFLDEDIVSAIEKKRPNQPPNQAANLAGN